MTNSEKMDEKNSSSPKCMGSSTFWETPVTTRRLSRICSEVKSGQTSSPTPIVSFTTLPVHTTPPSRLQNFVITNPFDETLRRRLHLSLISPTLFSRVVSPSQANGDFSWTIEDLSSLDPADIDEFQSQIDQPCDEEGEQEAQQRISRFFESNFVVQSPWGALETLSDVKLPQCEGNCTPVSGTKSEDLNVCNVLGKEAWTQTELTFPSNVPIHFDSRMESLAETCCGSTKETTSAQEEISFISPHKSLLSSTIQTPKNQMTCRTFGTPLNRPSLMSPIGLSPIVQTFQQVSVCRESLYSPDTFRKWLEHCKEEVEVDSAISDSVSQTDMTLPLTLPKYVEEALKPYHTFTQEYTEDEANLNSYLGRRRKLLFHEECDMSISSINSDNGYTSS